LKTLTDVLLKGTKTVHGDPEGVGFQIDYRGFKISYTSDTGYFEDLHKYHEGADILIAVCLGLEINLLGVIYVHVTSLSC